jgi:hypothetical protein
MHRVIAKVSRILAAVATLPTAGCQAPGAEAPDVAHFRVQASQPVRIVTSTSFLVGAPDATLLNADTLVAARHEATVQLPTPPRFYLEAIGLSAGTSIAVKVDVGDNTWCDAIRTIGPNESLKCLYGYGGATALATPAILDAPRSR